MILEPLPISSLMPPSSSTRKRKRSVQAANSSLSSWRTLKQHQIYSSNLLTSLRRLRPSPPTSSAVRSAADRALATAARGRSRWSRAILNGRGVHLKARKPKASLAGRSRGPMRSTASRSPASEVEAKSRALGKLVPGCRKIALPSLLDETADYIEALEMQVRTLRVLANLLSGGVAGGDEEMITDE